MLGAALVDIDGKFSFGGFRACRGSCIQQCRRGGNAENEVVSLSIFVNASIL